MRTFKLERTNDPDLRFDGELIATDCTSPDKNYGSAWSGETGRWKEGAIYRTKACKYVGWLKNHTQWQGEFPVADAIVTDDLNKLIEFFGHDWLAKQLYEEAGIDDSEEVE